MLELLKKHFEKLLLMVMLLAFAGMMLYLLEILRSTSVITDEDLMIETPDADYVPANPKDRKFDVNALFTAHLVKVGNDKFEEHSLTWKKTPPRNPGSKEFYTDLTEMFKSAVCPHEKCGRIVPAFYFTGKDCPLCKQKLDAPKLPVTPVAGPKKISASQDTDKDGIPDLVEIRYGLNHEKAEDALADWDGDGFSNLYEYLQGTDMKDPKKHPPLHQGLRVVAFEKTELPDRLLKVTGSGTTCQLETDKIKDGRKVRRSDFYSKGSKVALDGQLYTLEKITRKVEKQGLVTEDVSEVLFRCGDDTIVMVVNKPVYAPHQKVTVQSLFNGKTWVLKKGGVIPLGSGAVGREKYEILELNPLRENIVIGKEGGQEKVTIGTDYAVPEKYRVQSSAKANPSEGAEASQDSR